MNSQVPSARRDLGLLLLAGVVLIAAGIGLRDPWPADEPVYALLARTMLRTGHWLIPMVGGGFFPDKPPLLFWLQGFCYWLTGSERVGFLLPSLLAGLGTLALVYDLGRRLWNREAGWYAAWLLLFTVQFTLQARRGQQDALLMFCTVLSLYCLLRQLLLDGGWWWVVGAGLAAGFGTLAKVVGFLSCFVLVPWLYAVWRGWPGVKWQRPLAMWLLGPAAWGIVVGAWLLPIWLQARHDAAIAGYFHELVVTQTFGRYVAPWHHFMPAWYYLQVMATLWLPAVALLPWLVPRWKAALARREARVLLPLGFVVLYVLFFTLSRGKRDVYLLSALPMLVLPAGYLMPELLQRRGVQWLLRGLVVLVIAACAGLFAWVRWIDPARGAALLASGGVTSAAPLAALALAALAALLAWGRRGAQHALAITLAAGWLIAALWIFPQMDGTRSARDFIARLERVAPPGLALGLLAYHEDFLWQLHRPSVNFGNRRFREGEQEAYDAAAWLNAAADRQLLVPAAMLALCFATASHIEDVGRASGADWYLVRGSPSAGCVARGNAGRALYYAP
ncbi:MAG TPA: glycosyltransferase family 39 protein [Steroidobacteraceae bacterium]|nr:glycosyltransferase family 39 protein [Steroidobacteraceae bacterium]